MIDFLQKTSGTGLCCYKIEVITTVKFYGRHYDCGSLRCIHLHHENQFVYHVSFPFLLGLPRNFTFYVQLVGVSRKVDEAYQPMHMAYAHSVWWNPNCSRAFVSLYESFWVILCSLLCLSMSRYLILESFVQYHK